MRFYTIDELREAQKMFVLENDKFESLLGTRINNMNSDYGYFAHSNNGSECVFINPLESIWDLRIMTRYRYVDKKIDENFISALKEISLWKEI